MELFPLGLGLNTIKINNLIAELNSLNYDINDLENKITNTKERKFTVEKQLEFKVMKVEYILAELKSVNTDLNELEKKIVIIKERKLRVEEQLKCAKLQTAKIKKLLL